MKKIYALFIFGLLLFSCSKDNDATQTNTTTYTTFGYFQGTINYPNETAIPVIFLFENNNKLTVVQNSNTLNQSNNLQKGTYSVIENQISGSYLNENILPPTTFNFNGNFDTTTGKISGTIGTGTITLEKQI